MQGGLADLNTQPDVNVGVTPAAIRAYTVATADAQKDGRAAKTSRSKI